MNEVCGCCDVVVSYSNGTSPKAAGSMRDLLPRIRCCSSASKILGFSLMLMI